MVTNRKRKGSPAYRTMPADRAAESIYRTQAVRRAEAAEGAAYYGARAIVAASRSIGATAAAARLAVIGTAADSWAARKRGKAEADNAATHYIYATRESGSIGADADRLYPFAWAAAVAHTAADRMLWQTGMGAEAVTMLPGWDRAAAAAEQSAWAARAALSAAWCLAAAESARDMVPQGAMRHADAYDFAARMTADADRSAADARTAAREARAWARYAERIGRPRGSGANLAHAGIARVAAEAAEASAETAEAAAAETAEIAAGLYSILPAPAVGAYL